MYQATDAGSPDPVADCSVCSGYAYDAEFAVDTGTCSYTEFNQITEAFAVLYANLSSEEQHAKAMEQCMVLASTDDTAICFEDCAEVVSGTALTACMAVCVYDDSFGAILSFEPSRAQCNSSQLVCERECQQLGYQYDHCVAACATSCDFESLQRGGSSRLR
ncbi:MAG: hypothetical protein H6765_07100 [Candidatus Peribacteria bacterium]|nr:MAG: hypothetical protein H6765_07100 [Candidatus Peribacteria bacterium]